MRKIRKREEERRGRVRSAMQTEQRRGEREVKGEAEREDKEGEDTVLS